MRDATVKFAIFAKPGSAVAAGQLFAQPEAGVVPVVLMFGPGVTKADNQLDRVWRFHAAARSTVLAVAVVLATGIAAFSSSVVGRRIASIICIIVATTFRCSNVGNGDIVIVRKLDAFNAFRQRQV